MKTFVRKTQPWFTLMILLCVSFSFSFSQSNFVVTVTESSAGACKNPPCVELMPNLENVGGANDDCFEVTNIEYGLIQANFDLVLDLPEVMNHLQPSAHDQFVLTGQVYMYQNFSWQPVYLLMPSLSGGLVPVPGNTSFSNVTTLNANNLLNFNIGFSFLDPGACNYYVQFTLRDWTSGQSFALQPLHILNCDCGDEGRYRIGNSELEIEKLDIHPNPLTEDFLVVESQLSHFADAKLNPARISILNLQGQEVFVQEDVRYDQMGKMREKLSLANLSAGIYILQLKAGNSIKTQKMIKY